MHFEDIWEDAEAVDSKEFERDFHIRLDTIRFILDEFADSIKKTDPDQELLSEILGEILFEITGITRIHDINSALILKQAIERHKQRLMDPE